MAAPSSSRSAQPYALTDRYLAEHGSVFLTGIQALARLPLDQLRADRAAGWNTGALVTGYPGSPLGGYGEAVAEAAALAPELPLVFRQALNEELAASAVMGSQLASVQPDCRHDGIIGIWYGKAPGVERAADALRHAVFAGTSVRGGAVALVGDDPAAKSSTVPSSSAGLLADMHMPLLYPGDPAEALDLGRHAIALSRTTGLWCALKIVADVADATASVDLRPDRIAPVIPTIDGERYRHTPDGKLLTPHTLDIEREIVEVRYELATRYASQNRLNRIAVDPSDAWIGIVASGITAREVREALRRLGLASDDAIAGAGIRLLEMGMPFPFDPRTIRRFAGGLDQVLVIEEKRPTMESLIKDTLYDLADRPVVVGKHDEAGMRLFAEHGALDADAIVVPLRRRLAPRVGERLAPEPPPRRELIPLSVNRTPYYCSGCPHNRSTVAPPGALIGAGIGCHTMAVLMDPERFGDIAGVTCMGSEGAQWVGMAPFVERNHFIQNVGDGTYFHSAQLAVQNSVAAGVDITYKLLYNGAIAMTGGQEPQGQLPVGKVAEVLLAQGAAQVLVTTDDLDRYRSGGGEALPAGVEVWGRERLLEAQEVLAAVAGVTVLIHDQRCAAEARRDRKRGLVATPTQRVVINHRICEGCGDCGRVSNCLSVQPLDTPFGRKTTIDQTTCNFDYSCLEGDCPSFMTVDVAEPGPLSSLWRRLGPGRPDDRNDEAADRPSGRRGGPGDPPSDLPRPHPVVPTDAYAVRICGIGGTGVVTVAQIVGTAATLDGYHVRGLDQIGLSQKAGPVVSDVRVSRSAPTATNRLGAGQADLLLAFDQLVAASDNGLLTASPTVTTVVGSIAPVPTGAMIARPEISLPDPDDLVDRIASVTRPDAQHWADAQAITADLFGTTTTSNVFVVGMAVQAGCLPVDPARIEEAIALNDVAVEANTAAFRWGRAQIADPEAVATARTHGRGGGGPSPGSGVGADPAEPAGAEVPVPRSALPVPVAVAARIAALGRPDLVARLQLFAAELIAWGDDSAASGWLHVVERVSAAEHELASAGATAAARGDLTEMVAANLFKLTAYKDEYEVARLMTDPDGTAVVASVTRPGDRIAWKLHPPMLKALGMNGKISVGAWAEPAVRLLAKGKRLRGTPADPFGRTDLRRLERELPGEYAAAIDQALARLTADNLDQVVALAALADRVRGYEDLKLRRIADYRAALVAALDALGR